MAQRILVVDDGGESVRLAQAYLEQHGYEVLIARDGEMALSLLRRQHPDLLLLDLAPPHLDDGEAAAEMTDGESLAALPVVILATRIHDRAVVGLEPTPDDQADRLLSRGESVARVRAVLHPAQRPPPTTRTIRVGKVSMDLDAHQVQVEGRPVRLTPTEFALLRALAEQPGHALSRLEMAENGLGGRYEGLERTVDSHIKNLRRKLAAAGGTGDLVETVFGVGYRLRVSGQ